MRETLYTLILWSLAMMELDPRHPVFQSIAMRLVRGDPLKSAPDQGPAIDAERSAMDHRGDARRPGEPLQAGSGRPGQGPAEPGRARQQQARRGSRKLF